VGFIDSGTMLAEDNPQRLLFKYNCISLEDVFLELCLEKSRLSLQQQTIREEEEEDQERKSVKKCSQKRKDANNNPNAVFSVSGGMNGSKKAPTSVVVARNG